MTEKDTTVFPKTAADANQALAGIYQNLNQVNANPQCSFFYISMLASDDCLGGGGPNDKMMQAEDLLKNSGANMTEQFWKDRYQGINRANTLLDALENVDMDEATKAQTEGEAKFLRAFYYYELASQYNHVPLIITATAPDDLTPPAPSVIWGQILQDLRDAYNEMPARRLTNGHVDKYTVAAMLGRAWLFYTGMFCNGDEITDMVSTNYSPLQEVTLPDETTLTKQDVIAAIDDCVNNSGYSLVPTYQNLWAYTNKETVNDYAYTAGKGFKWVEDDSAVNPESMFAIKYNKLADWATTIGYGNGYALHFGVRGLTDYVDTFPFGMGWGAGPVAPNFVKDWTATESADIRRDASIQDFSADYPTYPGLQANSDHVQETGYYDKKQGPISAKAEDGTYYFCFEEAMYGEDGWLQGGTNNQLNNIHDLVLIRFADVLLMQSELKENVDGINKVRARAGLPAIGNYTLAALQNERRWELAFEGTRWNDIRRWHIAGAALEKQSGVDVSLYNVPGKNLGGYGERYNATAGFFNIPENQLSQLGSYGVEQNEGWTDSDSNYNGW